VKPNFATLGDRKECMTERFYCEWSVNSPISVRDRVTGKRWWFEKLGEQGQADALALPKFDINRGRFVKRRAR
jgi:hypothetical protein